MLNRKNPHKKEIKTKKQKAIEIGIRGMDHKIHTELLGCKMARQLWGWDEWLHKVLSLFKFFNFVKCLQELVTFYNP